MRFDCVLWQCDFKMFDIKLLAVLLVCLKKKYKKSHSVVQGLIDEDE
jgi:hypothetical protein